VLSRSLRFKHRGNQSAPVNWASSKRYGFARTALVCSLSKRRDKDREIMSRVSPMRRTRPQAAGAKPASTQSFISFLEQRAGGWASSGKHATPIDACANESRITANARA
jgi:hypothetical protein